MKSNQTEEWRLKENIKLIKKKERKKRKKICFD